MSMSKAPSSLLTTVTKIVSLASSLSAIFQKPARYTAGFFFAFHLTLVGKHLAIRVNTLQLLTLLGHCLSKFPHFLVGPLPY